LEWPPPTGGNAYDAMPINDCTALLRCPVCGADMEHDGHSLRCDRRHTFDIARQGYVDLLPAGHGRHTIEGDTREMIDARARVLEAALFEPLAACVAAIASASLARTAALRASTGDADTTSVILDCGCGTGYYLDRIAHHAANATSRLCLLGTDISTAALRRAARQVRAHTHRPPEHGRGLCRRSDRQHLCAPQRRRVSTRPAPARSAAHRHTRRRPPDPAPNQPSTPRDRPRQGGPPDGSVAS